MDGGRGAGFGVGSLPGLAVGDLVEGLAVQAEGEELLLRAVLGQAGDVDAVAHDRGAGIAFSEVQVLPELFRSGGRPLLEQAGFREMTVPEGAPEAVGGEQLGFRREGGDCEGCNQKKGSFHMLFV